MTEDKTLDDNWILEGANLGKDPSEHYLECVNMLDNVVRECLYVSRGYAGIRSPSGKHYYASVLFTALLGRAVSLINLVPYSPWAQKTIEHWDYASAAGIVRTMLELRLAYFYLCTEQCSEDEWYCRWNVFNLHDCSSRIRLMEAKGSNEQVAALTLQAEELKVRLNENVFFQGLPGDLQKRVLKGKTAYIYPLEDIGEKAGVPREEFRWLYILFSSHVHGLPMSFYRIGADGDGRGRGLPSPVEEGYTSLCLSLAASFLVKTRDEMHVLFDGLERPIPEVIGDVDKAMAEQKGTPMPIGQTFDLAASSTLRISVTRNSETSASSEYRYLPTDEVVLTRHDSESSGVSLQSFDPLFWTVTVNGGPATNGVIDGISGKPFAFRADPDARTLDIKTET